eukprot:m.240405 g.240405  ORF g.240405 m.240405 type:complete len:56 (-) comp15035_c0_seq1:115-282(-)
MFDSLCGRLPMQWAVASTASLVFSCACPLSLLILMIKTKATKLKTNEKKVSLTKS